MKTFGLLIQNKVSKIDKKNTIKLTEFTQPERAAILKTLFRIFIQEFQIKNSIDNISIVHANEPVDNFEALGYIMGFDLLVNNNKKLWGVTFDNTGQVLLVEEDNSIDYKSDKIKTIYKR